MQHFAIELEFSHLLSIMTSSVRMALKFIYSHLPGPAPGFFFLGKIDDRGCCYKQTFRRNKIHNL